MAVSELEAIDKKIKSLHKRTHRIGDGTRGAMTGRPRMLAA
jgi:hypothetical protein